MYRAQINSFNELPRDKRPPRKLWDRPFELSEYLEHVWDNNSSSSSKPQEFYEYDLGDVE